MRDWHRVHIVTRLELGGAQLVALHQARHSRFGKPRATLLYGPGGMLDAEVGDDPRLHAVAVPTLGRHIAAADDARAAWDIAVQLRRLRRHGRLLVQTHSSKAGIVGRWAAAATGTDCILHTIHGFGHQRAVDGPITYAALQTAERLTGRLTHGFIAVSAANLRQGRREGIIGAQPACVVPCGIDVAAFATPKLPRQRVRQMLGVPAHTPLVLTVACLKPQKDPLTWVDVAARTNAVFLLAGDGALRSAVQAAIDVRGLTGRVRLLGWRRDVPDLLHACDLVLSTARWEGLPQVFLQAMAAGKPVVATDVDGTNEAVQHGATGLLCAAGDAAGLAAAVRALLEDVPRRERFGRAARASVERFSQEAMMTSLDHFYTTVTGQLTRSCAERGR